MRLTVAESQTFCSELVEVGGFNFRAKTPDVAEPQVVRKDDQEVGTFARRKRPVRMGSHAVSRLSDEPYSGGIVTLKMNIYTNVSER